MTAVVDGDRPPEDLTARARIRDAALRQFAERGFIRATLKDIAEEAGVSVGLVQHHFETKEGLRQACDEAAMGIVARQLEGLAEIEREGGARPDVIASLYDTSPLLVRYLIRLLIDGSDTATTLFDGLASGTERFLSDVRPDLFPPGSEAAQQGAAVMTVMHLGGAVLESHLTRRLGFSMEDPASSARLGLVILDIYTAMADWIASDQGARAREAVARYVADLDSGAAGDKERPNE